MDLSGGLVGAFDGSVDSGSCYADEFGNFNNRVRSRAVNENQVFFQFLGELGLLSAQPSFCFGDSHPFKGSCSDQVCLEFGNHGQNIEQEPAHGIGGVWTEPPMLSFISRRVSSSTMPFA